MPTCNDCGKECEVYAEDIGIGPNEFWGSWSVDVCIVYLSKCCDAEGDGEDYGYDEDRA